MSEELKIEDVKNESKAIRTKRPISTVSYNSDDFLVDRLNALVEANLISFWAYINHKPEGDEKKFHKHLYIEPSRSLDTAVIRNYLKEIDKCNSKPLGVLPFRNSKFYDWYWYALHDKFYLAIQRPNEKEKEYHYSNSDIHCNDDDYFTNLVNTSPLILTDEYKAMQIISAEPNIAFEQFRRKMKSSCSARYYKLYREGLIQMFDDIKLELGISNKYQEEKEVSDDLVDNNTGEIIDDDDLPF